MNDENTMNDGNAKNDKNAVANGNVWVSDKEAIRQK